MFEDRIVTAAGRRDVYALVALRTTGGGGNMSLSKVGAPPWYILWNKVSAPTCLLCVNGWMATTNTKLQCSQLAFGWHQVIIDLDDRMVRLFDI